MWTRFIQSVAAVTACVTVLAGIGAAVARAADEGPTDQVLVKPTLLADADAATPGGAVTLGVRLEMAPHWHTYWVNPGETGDATKIKLTGPPGVEFGDVRWPLPTRLDAPGGVTFGYEDAVLLMVPVTLPKDLAGPEVKIEADVSWLVCREECVKGKQNLSITLPVSESKGQPANRELFETWRARLPVDASDPAAKAAVAKVAQPPAGGSGQLLSQLEVQWKQAPRKVEWFPVATRAVSIDEVNIKTEGQATTVNFNPTVFKPENVPGGRVDSVLVFEDADGRRVGISVPFTVPVTKPDAE